MEKVVKCNGCGQYFMHTEKVTKCPFPFCKTEYIIEVAALEEGESRPESGREEKASALAQGGQANGSASGGKDKKGTTKTQKKSFKIWGKN